MKQTTVEWLQEALEQTILTHEQEMQTIGLFEQAKEMEKEQIKKLLEIIIWYDEESDVRPDAEIYNWFKQYYNETFKSE